ncbi:hypothetical protein BLIN9172_03569, partial [Brevibacterium linens ATCC 9172]
TGPASQRLVFFIGEDQFSFRTTGARHTPFYNFLHEFTAQDTSSSGVDQGMNRDWCTDR